MQKNAQLVSAAPPTEDVNPDNKATTLLTSTTGVFEDEQRHVLRAGFTSEAPFEVGVSLDWMRSDQKATNFRVARRKKAHSPISPLLQAAVIPTHRRAYIFLSVGGVQLLRRIVWYSATYDLRLGLFHYSQISSVSKRAILCMKGAIGNLFYFSKNKEIMHIGFRSLEGWPDASALSKDVVTDLRAPSTIPKEIPLDMFRFIQSMFPGEDVLREKEGRTL